MSWQKLRIYKEQLIKIVQIGLPAGIQGSFFALSNVLVQSTINSFGSIVMAGNAAAANLESFIYMGMNCVHQSAVTFAGQNAGAGEYKRVRKNLYCAYGLVIAIAFIMCSLFYAFGTELFELYTDDTEAIASGLMRLELFCKTYFLCGLMDVTTGHVRGLGHSLVPMFITLLGVCVLRVFWIYVIFPIEPSLYVLYISYPVSWVMSTVGTYIYYQLSVKKHLV